MIIKFLLDLEAWKPIRKYV